LSVVSSGGGTRTPDTRIMIPLPDRHKSKADNTEPHINRRRAHPVPIDTRKLAPDLALVVDAWPSLPEAIRAGILALVRASQPPDPTPSLNSQNPQNARNPRPTRGPRRPYDGDRA
jgi:hypothetical protein